MKVTKTHLRTIYISILNERRNLFIVLFDLIMLIGIYLYQWNSMSFVAYYFINVFIGLLAFIVYDSIVNPTWIIPNAILDIMGFILLMIVTFFCIRQVTIDNGFRLRIIEIPELIRPLPCLILSICLTISAQYYTVKSYLSIPVNVARGAYLTYLVYNVMMVPFILIFSLWINKIIPSRTLSIFIGLFLARQLMEYFRMDTLISNGYTIKRK